MKRIVSLRSGGIASAVATQRVIDRHGTDDLVLWFADTRWEDEDLHRFLRQCVVRWGVLPQRYTDGRTPLQVAEDNHIIPNSLIAPCSAELKFEPFGRMVAALGEPFTVYLGLDWWEEHRFAAPTARYAKLGAAAVEFPLAWKPYELRPHEDVVRSWGIEPPRLYQLGFPHNNCGGRCVRQGKGEWERLLAYFPERFDEVMLWEEAQRAKVGAIAEYAICKEVVGGVVRPVTLRQIKERIEARGPDLFALLEPPANEDRIGCFCAAA